MHDSLVPFVKFHIDVSKKTSKGYAFSGWVLHEKELIQQVTIRAGKSLAPSVDFIERKDVLKAYPNTPTAFVGFNLEVEDNLENSKNDLELLVKFKDEFFKIADLKKPKDLSEIGKIGNSHPSIVAVDDFYSDPDAVREYALSLDFNYNKKYHKGRRTKERTFFNGTQEFLEDTLKKKITSWDNQPHNGVFQYCIAEDQLVYHTDSQTYAAVVFLTPNAPAEAGTSFFKHKNNGLRKKPSLEDCERLNKTIDELYWEMFKGNFYDKTPWETVDVIGNVYNRMAIWDASLVHAASEYFGDTKESGRLFHMFFFDAE